MGARLGAGITRCPACDQVVFRALHHLSHSALLLEPGAPVREDSPSVMLVDLERRLWAVPPPAGVSYPLGDWALMLDHQTTRCPVASELRY